MADVFDWGDIGLPVYGVLPDGTLDGVWGIADTDSAVRKVLTPIR